MSKLCAHNLLSNVELKRSCFVFSLNEISCAVVRLIHYKFWALRFCQTEQKWFIIRFKNDAVGFFCFYFDAHKTTTHNKLIYAWIESFFSLILKYITMHAIWWITLFSNRTKKLNRVNISSSKYFLIFLFGFDLLHAFFRYTCHMFMPTWRQINFKHVLEFS